jgi:hypothetical protein
MRYFMLIYESPEDLNRHDHLEGDQYVAAWRAYHKGVTMPVVAEVRTTYSW